MRLLACFFATVLAASLTRAAEPEVFPTDSRLLSAVAQAILVTDFRPVKPAAAATTGAREKGKWRIVPYATADFRGHALSAYATTGAPPVSIPLPAKGWHAVYIGVGTSSDGFKEGSNGLRAKLASQPLYHRMANNLPLLPARRDVIQECFLTIADLAGDAIQFAQVPFKAATIMYVKLVPLSAAEVAAWPTRTAVASDRPLIATFDGHSWIWPYRPRTAADLAENFEGFEDTRFTKWWFQVGGADLVCYPSTVGNVPGEGTTDFARWEHEEFTVSTKALIANGVNALQVAADAARAHHAEFHVFIRPAGWKGSIPWEGTFNSRFFEQHPEWRCIDRDGTPTLYMSYAVPQVRAHILAIFRESLSVKPDGVGILFHRGMPMILWEPAFRERFENHHHIDPRTIAENDPRILEVRAEIMTEFMREIRAMLDEAQRAQASSKRLSISIAAFSKESDNRKFGLDVERWVREGLVEDIAIAHFAYHTSFNQPVEIDYYKRITSGTKVGIFPFVVSWNPGSPAEVTARVSAYYQAGATGMAVWDPQVEMGWKDRTPGNVFDVLKLLGRESRVGRWRAHGIPQPLSIPLTQYDENYYSRWFPNTGF